MKPSEVLGLTRLWILEVIFWPRDDEGKPVFPGDGGNPVKDMADLAQARGMDPKKALEWAKKNQKNKGSRKGRKR